MKDKHNSSLNQFFIGLVSLDVFDETHAVIFLRVHPIPSKHQISIEGASRMASPIVRFYVNGRINIDSPWDTGNYTQTLKSKRELLQKVNLS